MIKKIFKAALVVATFTGFQIMASASASASKAGLLQYAQDPTIKEVQKFEPIKVASRRSRRRNRIIGGVFAAGVAAIILNEALRNSRRNNYSYNNRNYYSGQRTNSSYRNRRAYYRQCRRWADNCDYGSRRACHRWNKNCQ